MLYAIIVQEHNRNPERTGFAYRIEGRDSKEDIPKNAVLLVKTSRENLNKLTDMAEQHQDAVGVLYNRFKK